MKSKVIVDAGICGFITEINVESSGMDQAAVELKTNCPNISKMQEEITEVNPLEEFGTASKSSKIRDSFRKHSAHASCPVVSGIIKAVEVAAGLALPRDASIKISVEK